MIVWISLTRSSSGFAGLDYFRAIPDKASCASAFKLSVKFSIGTHIQPTTRLPTTTSCLPCSARQEYRTPHFHREADHPSARDERSYEQYLSSRRSEEHTSELQSHVKLVC